MSDNDAKRIWQASGILVFVKTSLLAFDSRLNSHTSTEKHRKSLKIPEREAKYVRDCEFCFPLQSEKNLNLW